MTDPKDLSSYPVVISEKVRISDTDRNDHVNNVSFSVFYESGRSALMLETVEIHDPGCFFVIASTSIQFLGEMNWPGQVTVANAIESFGRSSINLRQALFQDGVCSSTSTTTMVQLDRRTRKPQVLSDRAKAALETLMLRGPAE